MIEKVRELVMELLNNDHSGHGMDHIDRVLDLSLKFFEKEQGNTVIVSLIALLHDIDDYKLFGMESSQNLTNARRIMSICEIEQNIQDQVCLAISTIGYSKRLKGICPSTLEGKIVSDADMCDGLGANGILRTYQYQLDKGKPFFDRGIFPVEEMTSSKYKICSDTAVCHMFEKILKLKDLMLTEAGREEAKNRHQIVVSFLYHFFDELGASEWIEYLENYLKEDEKVKMI